MSLGLKASVALAHDVVALARSSTTNEFWVAPSFPCLSAVAEVIKGSSVRLGAQNCHWELSGAFTGETSVSVLAELGCSFVIVGHSERRHILKEDALMVEKRFNTAVKSGLTTILCVGETAEQRKDGQTEEVIRSQLEPCLKLQKSGSIDSVILAYEPVWAIGTGNAATVEQIEAAHSLIRKLLPLRVLYGGSVTPENLAAVVSLPSVAGGLIGGGSIDIGKLQLIAKAADSIR